MRVQFAIALAAMMIVSTAPATAQNSDAAAGNQAAATPAQKPDTAKKKASKPAGDKICKRLSQGKVCMTAEQWKAYQEVM